MSSVHGKVDDLCPQGGWLENALNICCIIYMCFKHYSQKHHLLLQRIALGTACILLCRKALIACLYHLRYLVSLRLFTSIFIIHENLMRHYLVWRRCVTLVVDCLRDCRDARFTCLHLRGYLAAPHDSETP